MTDQFTEDQSTTNTADGPSVQTSKNRPQRWRDYESTCQNFIEYQLYCDRALTDVRNQWVDWWMRYHGDNSKVRERMSKEELEWRAVITVPWDYSGIQTIVAHMLDLIRSVTPPVQAQGVGVEDDDAAAMENLFAYTLRINDFEGFCQDLITQACVQGVSFAKLTYGERARRFNFKPTQRDVLLFDKAIQDAVSVLKIPAPMSDAIALNLWMLQATQSNPSLKFPPIPVAGPKDVYTFRGPRLSNVLATDLYYDPSIKNIADQGVIIQKIRQPREWLLANAGPGKRFSLEAIQAAAGSIATTMVTEETRPILDQRKVNVSGDVNPFARSVDDVSEVWAPEMDPPYAVLLNQSPVPINNNVGEYPYEHGLHPYFAMMNVPSQFDGTGMSEYQRTMSMYEEADRIRSCHADSVALATYPAMKKLGAYGASSGVKAPRPSRIYTVQDLKDMAPLYGGMDQAIGAAMQYLQYVEQEIDAANGTYGQVRGADAKVGRVSATEQAGRMKSTMTRVALRLGNFERGMNPSLMQMLCQWAQFGSEEALRNIGGGSSPLVEVRRDKLYEAIGQDYAFVFSAQSQDPSMEIQQTGQILGMFQDVIQPGGKLELLAQLLSKLRIKNIQAIIGAAPPPMEAAPPQPGEGDMEDAGAQAEEDSQKLDAAAQQDAQEQVGQEVMA